MDKQFNATGTHVLLYNPETHGLWECPVGVVDEYVNHPNYRWEYATSEPDPMEGLVDEQEPGFDPSEHSPKEVSEYLAQQAENTAEVLRVIEAERAGKNRKSINVPAGFDPITGE